MATNFDGWTKELETELTTLASDMWATQKSSKKRVLGGGWREQNSDWVVVDG